LFPLLCLQQHNGSPKIDRQIVSAERAKEKWSPFHHHLIVRPPRPAAHYDSPASKLLIALHGVLTRFLNEAPPAPPKEALCGLGFQPSSEKARRDTEALQAQAKEVRGEVGIQLQHQGVV
jgi:hypothetical protein